LNSVEDLEKFKEENKVGIVLQIPETSGNLWKTWTSIAKEYEKLNFAHLIDAKVIGKTSGTEKDIFG
jgi:glycine cleavage system pyridoxal-binding protein P